MEDARRVLSEAAQVVGQVDLLPGDVAIALMGPSISRVAEVLELAVEAFLDDGEPLLCTITLSEG